MLAIGNVQLHGGSSPYANSLVRVRVRCVSVDDGGRRSSFQAIEDRGGRGILPATGDGFDELQTLGFKRLGGARDARVLGADDVCLVKRLVQPHGLEELQVLERAELLEALGARHARRKRVVDG